MRGFTESIKAGRTLRHVFIAFILFSITFALLTSAYFSLIPPTLAVPPSVYVDPASVVNTSLTPETTLTLRPNGDPDWDDDWRPCRTLRPIGDGTYTDWTGNYGDWDDWPTHNGDTDSVNATADAQNETSELENHSVDETWDIDKVRVVAHARTNETTDDQLALAIAIPATGAHNSNATAHTETGVTNPANAYDGNIGTSATLQPGQTDYLYLHTFNITGAPPSPIASVDFKMRYSESGGNPDQQYRILYKVSPSATETVLVDWTGDDHPLSTVVWASQPEPNDGSWSWTDISNIQFMVEARSTGIGLPGTFEEYEAWVTVNYIVGVALYEGTSHTLTTEYKNYTSEWSANPATALDWTWADIDTLEAGVISKMAGGTWEGKIMVTQLYVEVLGKITNTGKYKVWDESTENGDIDYMSTDDWDMYQTSALQNHTSETWDIARVRVTMVAKATSEECEAGIEVVIDGFPYDGESFALTTTYQTYTSEWGISPDTNTYWTWSEIDILEAGVTSLTVPSGEEIRVTQLYVEVSGPRLTVDIAVQDVLNLWGWQFELSYDPNVIEGVWASQYFGGRRTVVIGPFLSSAGGTVVAAAGAGWNNTIGKLSLTLAYLTQKNNATCPDGSGDIATVIFTVVGEGETEIRLDGLTGLQDTIGFICQGRDCVTDGSFRNEDLANIPSVSFSMAATSPAPEPIEGYNTTFTAIVSGGTAPYSYKWYFWVRYRNESSPLLDGPIITSTPTTSHNFTNRGTWNVTLTVIDNIGVVGTNTSYILIKAHDIYLARVVTNTTMCFYPQGVNITEIDGIVAVDTIIENEGDFTENNINVSCFWSATIGGEDVYGSIGSFTGINLAAGANTTRIFYWDTTGRNQTHATSYVIHVNASRMPFEYDIEWGTGKLVPNERLAGDPIRVQMHDIAVISVSTNATGQTVPPGTIIRVRVTVRNHGDFNETSIVVKVFAEKSPNPPVQIGVDTVPLMSNQSFALDSLPGNDTTTIDFHFDTTPVSGNYTFFANATQANYVNDYEKHDNQLTDGWVNIQTPLLGDLDGDSDVDAKDLYILTQAYDSEPGDGNWNASADLNGDSKVDDADIAILVGNYGTGA